MYNHQQSKTRQQYDQLTAAVADQRQRHADHRQQATDHADINEYIDKKGERHAAGQQLAEGLLGVVGDVEAPGDDQQIDQYQQGHPDQTELLGQHGNDEVGMPFGQEVQMGLGALQPALAIDAARADGCLGLDDVPAGPQRVALGIEQRQHPLFLVRMHDKEPHGHRAGHQHDQSPEDITPAQPGQQQAEDARGSDQQGGPQIRLFEDQHHRHHDDRQAHSHMLEARRHLPPPEIPGHAHRHHQLHDLRRLEGDDPGDAQPALGPLGLGTHHQYRQQQQRGADVGHRHPTLHEPGLDLGNEQHHRQPDRIMRALAIQHGQALAAGRIEYEAGGTGQNQDQQQQPGVDMNAHPQWLPTQSRAGSGDSRQGLHGITSSSMDSGSGSGSGNSQASNSMRPTGAATRPPDSPFSTITATAIWGSSTGAKPTNRA